jgi:hypothetical protein
MPTAPDSTEPHRPPKRGGRMSELAVGWLHGEGYIDGLEEVQLRPCATDLGFCPSGWRWFSRRAGGLCWHPAVGPSPRF